MQTTRNTNSPELHKLRKTATTTAWEQARSSLCFYVSTENQFQDNRIRHLSTSVASAFSLHDSPHENWVVSTAKIPSSGISLIYFLSCKHLSTFESNTSIGEWLAWVVSSRAKALLVRVASSSSRRTLPLAPCVVSSDCSVFWPGRPYQSLIRAWDEAHWILNTSKLCWLGLSSN